MSRIDELQKKYPSIPRDFILSQDVVVHGVKDAEDIDKISSWQPTGWRGYSVSDYDRTFEDLVKKTPERFRQGALFLPKAMKFKSGLGASVHLRSTSPYTVREVSEGRFALCEGEEKVDDIYFPRPQPRTGPEPVTSKGTPISQLIDFNRCCFRVFPLRYCEYFNGGDQCWFCNTNVTGEQSRSAGLQTPLTLNPEETAEAYKIRCAEVGPLLEGGFVGGGMVRIEPEVKMYYNMIEKIAGATPKKPNITLKTQAYDRKSLERLRDAGVDAFSIQIEVMDPQMFAEICPGKAKHLPYEGWLECIQNAVDVFGVGQVAVKLVPGFTLFAPSGHKTWQEARDHHIEANRWIIKNGALPAFSAMYPSWGSVLSQRDPSFVDKFPPVEYELEVAEAHHEAMLEAGLYDKMNKLLFCAFDYTYGLYAGDIGMINIAGDVGNWMADVVPPEANWMAQFVASVKSPARTE